MTDRDHRSLLAVATRIAVALERLAVLLDPATRQKQDTEAGHRAIRALFQKIRDGLLGDLRFQCPTALRQGLRHALDRLVEHLAEEVGWDTDQPPAHADEVGLMDACVNTDLAGVHWEQFATGKTLAWLRERFPGQSMTAKEWEIG